MSIDTAATKIIDITNELEALYTGIDINGKLCIENIALSTVQKYGAYSTLINYRVGTIVVSGTQYFKCLSYHNNVPLTDASVWKEVFFNVSKKYIKSYFLYEDTILKGSNFISTVENTSVGYYKFNFIDIHANPYMLKINASYGFDFLDISILNKDGAFFEIEVRRDGVLFDPEEIGGILI